MAYATESSFPNTIDDLLFLSDVDYENKSIYNSHQEYILNGEYSNASEYINSQIGITPITASLFNLIGDRTRKLQIYLKEIIPCLRCIYGEEPIQKTDGMMWVE